MENTDIEKIEQIIRDRKHAHKYFTEHSQAYGAFVNLAKVAFARRVGQENQGMDSSRHISGDQLRTLHGMAYRRSAEARFVRAADHRDHRCCDGNGWRSGYGCRKVRP